MKTGGRFKELRALLGISQVEAGYLFSVTPNTIRNWEANGPLLDCEQWDVILLVGGNPLYIISGSGTALKIDVDQARRKVRDIIGGKR